MIADISRWPGRVLLTLASIYAGLQLIIYGVVDLALYFKMHPPPMPPEDSILRDPVYFQLILYTTLGGLAGLTLLLPLLWPRIFIWPVLGMLALLQYIYISTLWREWIFHDHALAHFFAELPTNIVIVAPAVFFILLLPAAWRLLRRKRLPPPEGPPAQNRPE